MVVTSGEDCERLDTGIELLLVSHFGRTCVSKLHPGRNDRIQKLSRSASSWTRHHIEVPRQSNAVLQSQQQEDDPSSHVCDVQRQLLNPRSSQSGSQDRSARYLSHVASEILNEVRLTSGVCVVDAQRCRRTTKQRDWSHRCMGRAMRRCLKLPPRNQNPNPFRSTQSGAQEKHKHTTRVHTDGHAHKPHEHKDTNTQTYTDT